MTIATTGLCIMLVIFTKKISLYLGIAKVPSLNDYNRNIINIVEWIDVIGVAYLSLFLLYYYVELKKIETFMNGSAFLLKNETSNSRNFPSTENRTSQHSENGKLKDLYQKIIENFENEKPYQNPNFNIKKLAEDLETNSTYISRALNLYGKKNFSTLVNDYRISQVKEELTKSSHLKFTLEYVYTKAGFSNQPTFNRVFKEYTGITPSEYIYQLSKG